MQTALETALEYAAKGWFVFPIVPGTKFPYKGSHWREDSTNDPNKIEITAEMYPNSNWALDCGKSEIFVLDIDTAKGATPPEILETFTVQTPSGGYHEYYTGTGPTSTGSLGPGLDTRGTGGYVLIPGSINNKGVQYKVLKQYPVKPIPSRITGRLNSISQKKNPQRDIPLTQLNQKQNITRAINYLQNEAPEAIEGNAGDNTTYTVICRLRDFGLTPDKALSLLIQENGWNDIKAQPPWTYSDLEKKVYSAYKYAKDRPGNASVDILFPEAEETTGTESIRRVSEIKPGKIKPRDWLLGYRYLPGYVTLTIAPGGVGKSLFTILEAVSVATGKMLTGDKVFGGGGSPVWLYNTEDPFDELERRFLAVMKYYQIAPSEVKNLYYSSAYKTPLTIAAYDNNKKVVINEKLVKAITEEIKKREIKLFTIDPLIECHDLVENDNPGMNRVLRVFRGIAFETKCAISIVHHSSKGTNGGKGAGNIDAGRGASSITSAARIAHTLYPMSLQEAKEYSISVADAAWYIRMDDAKSNLGPPIGSRGQRWFKKISVPGLSTSKETNREIETTGTLVLQEDMVKVVSGDGHDKLIVEAVTSLVGLNENKPVATLAKEIAGIGIIQLRLNTLRSKIEELFGIPVVKAGFIWSLSQTMAANNRVSTSIICHIDDI